ncbi:MAG: ChaN family lipoprotein [bacterium]|nr:ChaN family lipoprotein [bacterium]
MRKAPALSALLLVLSLGCTAAPPADRPLAGGAPHPLEGKIYLPAEKKFISAGALIARMADAEILYLGERHDNPMHHALQLRILKEITKKGGKAAVAFEMFPRDTGPALADLLSRPGADLSRVPEIVGWNKRGWPAWGMYAPLVETAYLSGHSVVALDLPPRWVRRVARAGLSALPDDIRGELALGSPDAAHKERVIEDLFDSHCRVIPRAHLGGLYASWRARNRTMARSLQAAMQKGAKRAVVITGGGHADKTTGIPPDIAGLSPSLRQFSLSFVEVQEGIIVPGRYIDRSGSFDTLWFTLRHDREDPCRKYRKALERLRDRK